MIKRIIKITFILTLITNNLLYGLEKTTLQLEWKHQFEFAGFYAAIEKGYYKDIGIELEIKEFHDGINISEDVINGKSTFGISSSALILERLKNKPVVLIASYFKQNALALVTKPNIKTPHDLKNKKIMALDWEMGHTSLGVMLKDYEINKEDYSLVSHNYKIDNFVNGKVDAMSIFTTSQPYELDKLGIKYNILNPANFGIYSYDVELFTSENIINKNPKMVHDFVEATNKGWEYAFKNKEEIVNLIYNKYSKRKTKEALLYEANQTEQIFKTNIFKIGAIAPELIKLNADMYINLDLVDKNLDITNLLNNYYKKENHLTSIGLTLKEEEYLRNNPLIKVHNESSWPPYNYNIDKTPKGFSIDYMNLLASKLGVKIEYISGFTWKEYIEKLKNNEIDVMLNISKTPQREEYFNFTTSYIKSIDTVFIKKGSNFKSLEDFNGKTIAIIKGFYEEELLKKHYPNIKLISTKDTIESLKKVAFGEVDGAIDSFAVGNYYIQNDLISNLKPAFEIEDERFNLDMHLATNKNNEILRDILEKTKGKIKEEELIELKRKWINEKEFINNNTNIYLTPEERSYLKNKKEITMCIDPDREPFEIINKNGIHEGIAADLINLISKKLDIKIKLIPTKTWEESLTFSKEKKCDILSFLNETAKRKEWLNFTNPIFEDPNVIVGRNEFEDIKDLSTLPNNTIAIPKGTAMYERFEKDFPNLIIVPVETENEAFSLVENRRVDMTVRSLIIVAYNIKKDNLFNLKIIAKPLKYKNQLRIGVIKDEAILVNILNKSIKSITKKEQENIINNHVSIKIPENYEYLANFIYALLFIFLITMLILFWNYQLRKKIAIEIKKNTEQQNIIFQQNKKAELGNLIANISHQWRDSLTKIGYINLNLRARLIHNKEVSKDFLDKNTLDIEKSLDFMSETMRNFLDYYKPSSNISDIEVYDSIKSALTIIDTKIKYSNLEIIFHGDFSVKIEGIKNEWMQVWINLIINTINISGKREIKNPKVEIILSSKEIIFQDNCGKIDSIILEEFKNNNFRGIGLKMAKEIASKNNHYLNISNSKIGAIFKFVKLN